MSPSKVLPEPIPSLWRQIDGWMVEHAPQVLSGLFPGVTEAEIAALEKSLITSGAQRLKLPLEVRQSWRIHNGQSPLAVPLIGDWQLLQLRHILKQWQINQELLESGGFQDNQADSDGSVKPMWWNPRWIPLAYNGAGDLVCLDMDPPEGYPKGRLITFWHVDARRQILAVSWSAWLAKFARDLLAGKIHYP